MQELARYWATDYDWRRCEAELNAPAELPDRDRRAGHPLHPRPLAARGRAPADRHARLARLDHRAAEDHRAAHRSHVARRQRGGRVPPGDPLAPRPRVLRQAGHHRLGSGAHRPRLGGADAPPRIHRVRRAGRRLGRGRDADHGHPGGRRGCSASTPTCPAPPRPTSSRASRRGDPPPSGLSDEERHRVRAAARLLRAARGVRADHVDASADDVRAGGLTHRSRGLRARPRRRDRPARPGQAGPRGDAWRATSRETTSSTTSRSTG